MRRLEIINGPNNNFYGIRNKDVYGSQTYDGLIAELMEYGAGLGFEVHAYQNNSEGALIDPGCLHPLQLCVDGCSRVGPCAGACH